MHRHGQPTVFNDMVHRHVEDEVERMVHADQVPILVMQDPRADIRHDHVDEVRHGHVMAQVDERV